MFWPEPFNLTAAIENCNDTWGVQPSQLKAQTEWGGRRIEAASNIVVGATARAWLRGRWRGPAGRRSAGAAACKGHEVTSHAPPTTFPASKPVLASPTPAPLFRPLCPPPAVQQRPVRPLARRRRAGRRHRQRGGGHHPGGGGLLLRATPRGANAAVWVCWAGVSGGVGAHMRAPARLCGHAAPLPASAARGSRAPRASARGRWQKVPGTTPPLHRLLPPPPTRAPTTWT